MLRGWKPWEIAQLQSRVRDALHWGLWVEEWADDYAAAAANPERAARYQQLKVMLFPGDDG